MNEAEWLASTDPAAMLRHLVGDETHFASAPHYEGHPLASDRKLRLFASQCVRVAYGSLEDPEGPPGGWTAAQWAARWADMRGPCADEPNAKTRAALLRDICGNPFRPVTLPITHRKNCDAMPGATDRAYSHCSCPCPWLTPTVLDLARAAYDEAGRECPARCVLLPNPPETLKGKHLQWEEGVGWHICPTCHGTGSVEQDRETYAAEYGIPPYEERIEACPDCKGAGRIDDGTLDNQRLMVLWDALEESGCDSDEMRSHLTDKTTHVRGCWVVDLILGLE